MQHFSFIKNLTPKLFRKGKHHEPPDFLTNNSSSKTLDEKDCAKKTQREEHRLSISTCTIPIRKAIKHEPEHSLASNSSTKTLTEKVPVPKNKSRKSSFSTSEHVSTMRKCEQCDSSYPKSRFHCCEVYGDSTCHECIPAHFCLTLNRFGPSLLTESGQSIITDKHCILFGSSRKDIEPIHSALEKLCNNERGFASEHGLQGMEIEYVSGKTRMPGTAATRRGRTPAQFLRSRLQTAMNERKATPLPPISPLPALLKEIDAFMLIDDEVRQANCSDSELGSWDSSDWSEEGGFFNEDWVFPGN
jgi:hypothetical protein